MKDLTTTYLGLELRNPVIAASSGLTSTLDGLVSLEKNGTGAVVLKSIFEEEILKEAEHRAGEADKDPMIYSDLSETLDYIDLHIREDNLQKHLQLIRDAKAKLSIPVIGSINCVSWQDWTHFARQMQEAGADALELNLFLNPADFGNKEFEKSYFLIIEKVLKVVDLPVSIKISRYFTRLGLTMKALAETGVAGIVLFNRFFTPDVDIEKMSLTSGRMFSTPEEQSETLRWIAIMSERVDCNLAASTGIHTGQDAIKMILAGATAVQVASTLYKSGPDQISRIIKQMEQWMESKNFRSPEEFRGKISSAYQGNPASFERLQFMKNFSEIG